MLVFIKLNNEDLQHHISFGTVRGLFKNKIFFRVLNEFKLSTLQFSAGLTSTEN